MDSKNSNTSNRHRLLLILLDKINLKRKDKLFALSNLSIYYRWIKQKQKFENISSDVE